MMWSDLVEVAELAARDPVFRKRAGLEVSALGCLLVDADLLWQHVKRERDRALGVEAHGPRRGAG